MTLVENELSYVFNVSGIDPESEAVRDLKKEIY